MTAQEVKRLSQPVVQIYEELTSELMEQIAAQLARDGDISATSAWRAAKLAQLGELNKNAVATIAHYTAVCPQLTQVVLQQAALDAVQTLEPALRGAAEKGLLQNAPPLQMSRRMAQTIEALSRQATSQLNLVNTVMGYKVRDAYTGIANKTADLAERVEYLSILGKNAASAVSGLQARQMAVRQCIKEFSEKGLPGFVDKRGREWSPEAYVNMDIRTTVTNTAHAAQFARMDDYDCDLLSLSSHSGARPGCEPYQGKVYSRSGKSGHTKDLHGASVPYYDWHSTTYGQPDGVLGINCGHFTNPFVPGYSVMRYEPTKNKAQNDADYKRSQRQRTLERGVKASKRECAMFDRMGDKEGFADAALRLKQRTQTLEQFCEQTGRARKRDREQAAGFGKSTSAKSQAVVAKYGKYRYNESGQIVVTDDWKDRMHASIQRNYRLFAVIETKTTNRNGSTQTDRTFYDANGIMKRQTHSGAHGYPLRHPYGIHGEHAHDYEWIPGQKQPNRTDRDLTFAERIESSDIL